MTATLNAIRDQMTSLQPLLGIELPITQAPMAGVQGSALAVAVSNAVPPYASNVPRPRFDEVLLANAVSSGVKSFLPALDWPAHPRPLEPNSSSLRRPWPRLPTGTASNPTSSSILRDAAGSRLAF